MKFGLNVVKKAATALLLVSLLLSLAACGTSGGTTVTPPEGMKLCATEDGYTLFVPEDWNVDLSTGIPTASVSDLEKAKAPSVTLVRVLDERTPAEYFAAYTATLASMLDGYEAVAENDNTTMGKKPAITRTYRGTVLGKTYVFKQYLAAVDGYIYTLTYTALDEKPETGGKTYFERYEDTVATIASSLLFTGTSAEAAPTEPTYNENGLKLASDPAVSRYSFWVPAAYELVLQNGTTSAVLDGVAVTLSYEIPTGNSIAEYWEDKSATYADLLESFAVIDAECSPPVEKLEDVTVWLGNRQAVKYVFTYTYHGVTYKSVKLMTVEGVYVYTLTYTAPYTGGADCPFTAHYADLDTMAAAFSFK